MTIGANIMIDDSEMEKRADTADISVLFFFGCAIFLAVYAQTSEKHCAKSTLL